jgi:hypothetical protein
VHWKLPRKMAVADATETEVVCAPGNVPKLLTFKALYRQTVG